MEGQRKSIILIAAITSARGLGVSSTNSMPWHLPPDLAFFQQTTASHAVIMGRNTWSSIPPQFRPLKNRINVIVSNSLSSSDAQPSETHIARNFAQAINLLENLPSPPSRVFVIGGARMYQEAIDFADRLILTRISEPDFSECDVFFPKWNQGQWSKSTDEELWEWTRAKQPKDSNISYKGTKFTWEMWTRTPIESK